MPAAVFRPQPIRSEHSFGFQLQLAARAAEAVQLESLGENFLAARVLRHQLHPLPRPRTQALGVVTGAVHPEPELDLLARPIHGPVGHNEGLDTVIVSLVPPAMPHAGEPHVGKSARFRPGHHQPTQPARLLLFAQHDLPVGVGELREIRELPRADAFLVFPLSPVLPAEKLHIGSDDRLAGNGVSDEIHMLPLVQPLGNNRGVRKPKHDETCVAAGHLRPQQIRPALLQRRSHGDAFVKMSRARLKLQRPIGNLLAEVLFLVLMHQPIA